MAVKNKQDTYAVQMLEDIMRNYNVTRLCLVYLILTRLGMSKKMKWTQIVLPYNILGRVPTQISHLNRLVGVTDNYCLVNFQMDRNAFGRLCSLFRQLGTLRDKRFIYIEEQVTIFLGILAHQKKNHVFVFDYWRSGHTVSRYVHKVLGAILKMHSLFVVNPEPIPEDCVDWR